MWVLQGAICSWPRDMSFSHCPFPSSPRASLRQALPSPLLQPPLLSLRLFHQTKHHLSGKQLPEAALLEQMPPCPPAQSHCHIHLPGVPHTAPCVCHTLPHVCARCPRGFAVLSAGWRSQSPVSSAIFLLSTRWAPWDSCVGIRAALSTWAAPPLHPPWVQLAGAVTPGCLHSCQGLPAGSALPPHNSHPTGSRSPPCQQELEAETATPSDPVHTGTDAD